MHLFLTPLPVSVGKLWQGRAMRGLGPSRGTATLGAGMSKAAAQGSQRELSRHHPQCKAHPKNGLGMTVTRQNGNGAVIWTNTGLHILYMLFSYSKTMSHAMS